MFRKDDPPLNDVVAQTFRQLAGNRDLLEYYTNGSSGRSTGEQINLPMSPQLEEIFTCSAWWTELLMNGEWDCSWAQQRAGALQPGATIHRPRSRHRSAWLRAAPIRGQAARPAQLKVLGPAFHRLVPDRPVDIEISRDRSPP